MKNFNFKELSISKVLALASLFFSLVFIAFIVARLASTLSLAPGKSQAVSPACQDTVTLPTPAPTPPPGCTYQFLYKFNTSGMVGPKGLTKDNSDNIYITDNTSVHKYTRDGTFITEWGSLGTGNNQFGAPFGISYGPCPNGSPSVGCLYIADRKNSNISGSINRVQVFDINGNPVTRWALNNYPYDVAVSPTNSHIYVSENYYMPKKVEEFTASGTLVNSYTSYTTGDNDGFNPYGLSFDTSGNLYMISQDAWLTRRTCRLRPGASTFDILADLNCSTPRADFFYVWQLGIDNQGSIYVPESYAGGQIAQVDKYAAADGYSGNSYCGKIGSYGTAPGQFTNPQDVVADSRGYVFISDLGGYIHVFSCSGVGGQGIKTPTPRPTGSGVPTPTPVKSSAPGSGPVGFWKFDEGSGWVINDSSGSGNGGFTKNGPTWTSGKFGAALSFDKVDDYVNLGSNSSLDNLINFTWSAWINPRSYGEGDRGRIMGKSTPGGFERALYLDNASGDGVVGTLYFNLNDSAGRSNLTYSVNNTIKLNTWQHVAVTFSYSTDKKPHLYLNGREVTYSKQTTLTALPWNDSPYYLIVGNRENTDRTFDGIIDEVQVYNRALTSTEIARLATIRTLGTSTGVGVPATPMLAPNPTPTFWQRLLLFLLSRS